MTGLELEIEDAIREGEQPAGEGFYNSLAADAVLRVFRNRLKTITSVDEVRSLLAELGEG